MVNSMANFEHERGKFGEMIENCNTVLALLGHTNRQMNISMRDFLETRVERLICIFV